MPCILCQYTSVLTPYERHNDFKWPLSGCFFNSACAISKHSSYQDKVVLTIWKNWLAHTCIDIHIIYIEIGKLLNCYLWFELSGWVGSVTYGLGADISLPHCLATGIWTLAPKATSWPKSQGKSFGTALIFFYLCKSNYLWSFSLESLLACNESKLLLECINNISLSSEMCLLFFWLFKIQTLARPFIAFQNVQKWHFRRF